MGEPDSKRARVDPELNARAESALHLPRFEDLIYYSINQIPSCLEKRSHEDLKSVEIEVRIGLIVLDNFRRAFFKHSQPFCQLYEKQTMLPGASFVSGVDEIFSRIIKKKLRKELFDKKITKQILLCDEKGNRYERTILENGTNAYTAVDRKEKVHQFNLALLGHEYDMRIGIAFENKSFSTQKLTQEPSWSIERNKSRITYIPKKLENSNIVPGIWQIDYTEVISKKPSNTMNSSAKANENYTKEYELELELNPNIQFQFLTETDPSKRAYLGNKISHQLILLLNLLIPQENEQINQISFNQIDVSKYEKILQSINTMNYRLQLPNHVQEQKSSHESLKIIQETKSNGNRGRKNIEFLGSMPINLYRSSLNLVLSNEYFMTEKSDGVRYLMFVIPGRLPPPYNIPDIIARYPTSSSFPNDLCPQPDFPVAIFMDRARHVFVFPNNHLLGILLSPNNQEMLLDGEIVYNLTMKRNVFLLFDVMIYQNQSLVYQPFSQRYQIFRENIFPSFLDSTKAINLSNFLPNQFLLLMTKKFVPKSKFPELLSNFKVDDQTNEFSFVDTEQRHHKTDGIIFQPDLPYVFSKNYDLFKWKWSHMRTIDLGVAIESDASHPQNINFPAITKNNIFLFCAGPDGSYINCSKRGDYNISLSQFDTFRLLADYFNFVNLHRGELQILPISLGPHTKYYALPIIVEFSYDTTVGLWVYHKIRQDKKESNYIDSVLGVFTEQAEAVSLEELEFTLTAVSNNMDYDFDENINKMKRDLLNWQKKQTKPSK